MEESQIRCDEDETVICYGYGRRERLLAEVPILLPTSTATDMEAYLASTVDSCIYPDTIYATQMP